MPWLSEWKHPLPEEDLLSWTFDHRTYDPDKPVSQKSFLRQFKSSRYRSLTGIEIYYDLETPSRNISWRQGRSIVRKVVAGFRKAGLKPGDCVSITSFNDVSGSSISWSTANNMLDYVLHAFLRISGRWGYFLRN